MTTHRRGIVYSSHGTSPEREHWIERAACRNADPEAFTPPPDQYRAMTADEAAYALTYCNRCPVRRECFDDATRHGDTFGIRGGVDLASAAARRTARGLPVSGCGGSGGRRAHEAEGTPLCRACLDHEQRLQIQAALRRWNHLAPLLDRGLTYQQAALKLNLSVTTIRRTHQIVKRQQRQNAA